MVQACRGEGQSPSLPVVWIAVRRETFRAPLCSRAPPGSVIDPQRQNPGPPSVRVDLLDYDPHILGQQRRFDLMDVDACQPRQISEHRCAGHTINVAVPDLQSRPNSMAKSVELGRVAIGQPTKPGGEQLIRLWPWSPGKELHRGQVTTGMRSSFNAVSASRRRSDGRVQPRPCKNFRSMRPRSVRIAAEAARRSSRWVSFKVPSDWAQIHGAKDSLARSDGSGSGRLFSIAASRSR